MEIPVKEQLEDSKSHIIKGNSASFANVAETETMRLQRFHTQKMSAIGVRRLDNDGSMTSSCPHCLALSIRSYT